MKLQNLISTSIMLASLSVSLTAAHLGDAAPGGAAVPPVARVRLADVPSVEAFRALPNLARKSKLRAAGLAADFSDFGSLDFGPVGGVGGLGAPAAPAFAPAVPAAVAIPATHKPLAAWLGEGGDAGHHTVGNATVYDAARFEHGPRGVLATVTRERDAALAGHEAAAAALAAVVDNRTAIHASAGNAIEALNSLGTILGNAQPLLNRLVAGVVARVPALLGDHGLNADAATAHAEILAMDTVALKALVAIPAVAAELTFGAGQIAAFDAMVDADVADIEVPDVV